MSEKIKAITFDLDDTFWDVKPVLINAEMKTRKFIEDKIGKLEWGSWEEFKLIREKLIIEDASYEFDVGKLRKKLLLMKIQERISDEETANELITRSKETLIKEKEAVALKLKELGVEESLINLKGMTQGMLVILGQKNIKKISDFADLSSDELIGGFDEKRGQKIRIEGYLEEFSLSRKEADELIMAAREIVYK